MSQWHELLISTYHCSAWRIYCNVTVHSCMCSGVFKRETEHPRGQYLRQTIEVWSFIFIINSQSTNHMLSKYVWLYCSTATSSDAALKPCNRSGPVLGFGFSKIILCVFLATVVFLVLNLPRDIFTPSLWHESLFSTAGRFYCCILKSYIWLNWQAWMIWNSKSFNQIVA